MESLVIFGLMVGFLGSLILALIAAIIALLLQRALKTWTVERLANVSSSGGPLAVVALLSALIVDVSTGTERVSGPEAQGLMVFGLAGLVIIILGWLLGRWAVLRLLR